MAKLTPCAACDELVFIGTCVCPHCGDKACASPRVGKAVLLGLTLALTGCPVGQAKYGVPDTGGDTATPTSSREVPELVEVLITPPPSTKERPDD